MSWLVYNAAIPLEIQWPSGIVATCVGLVTCGVCLLLIGLAARAFGRSDGKDLTEAVPPAESQDQPRPAAA